jgi:hypothetical protein
MARTRQLALWLMSFVIIPGATGVQAQSATPQVAVQRDAGANGWKVQISFGAAPAVYARAGHAWTEDHARDLARQWVEKNSALKGDLAVAGVRMVGKDGNGTLAAGQGYQLADWPIVEHDFRVRTGLQSDAVAAALRDTGAAYQAAAKATEELLCHPAEAPSAAKQQAIGELYQAYNQRVDDLGKQFFKGHAPPLPRLRLLGQEQWTRHAADWADAMQNQHAAEQLHGVVRAAKSDLDDFRKAVLNKVNHGTPAKDVLDLARQMSQRQDAVDQSQMALEKVQRAVNQQQSALDSNIADATAKRPPADNFSSGKNGAVYVDQPSRVMLYKADDKGEPLPDDQQPAGYPKPLFDDQKPGKGEAAVVDPNLRVMPLDREPGDVKAGIYGKVTDIDPKAGTVTVQVDERGTTLEYSGVDPAGIQEGDFIQPSTPIGRWKPPAAGKQNRELNLRAWSPSDQQADPRSVLEFATYPPAAPQSLKRNVPDADATPLPVKVNPDLPPPFGKGEKGARLAYDESLPKELASGKLAKNAALDARESLAKGELKRRQDARDSQLDASSLLNAKLKQLQKELKDADAKARDLDQQVAGLNDKLKGDKQAIAADREALRRSKQALEAEAARIKGSRNNAAIDAYNQKAAAHNRLVDQLETDQKSLKDDTGKLQQARDQQRQNQATRMGLQDDINRLQPQQRQAQSALDGLDQQVRDQQSALKSILDSRIQLNRPPSK